MEIKWGQPESTILIPGNPGHDYGGIQIIDANTHEAIRRSISGSNARGLSFESPGDQLLYAFAAQDADITFLGVSHSGSMLASGAKDGSIRVWDFDIDNWIEKACQKPDRNLREEWGMTIHL